MCVLSAGMRVVCVCAGMRADVCVVSSGAGCVCGEYARRLMWTLNKSQSGCLAVLPLTKSLRAIDLSGCRALRC